ncbi:MAG: hypothetical protein ACK4UL_13730, partial [Novosphingobium meiothermophilum]
MGSCNFTHPRGARRGVRVRFVRVDEKNIHVCLQNICARLICTQPARMAGSEERQMISSYLRRSTAACALVASALAPSILSAPAYASTAAEAGEPQAGEQATETTDNSDRLSEIVVTALRRDSNLQSTPVAVSAV